MSNQINCDEFRPHHMRPDKCRKCFGDKEKHQQILLVDQQATSATKEAQDSQQNAFQIELKVNELNREQLVDELKRVFEENHNLKSTISDKNNQISNLESELEKLRANLVKGSNNVINESSNSVKTCDKCQDLGRQLEELKKSQELLIAERDRANEDLKSLEHEMEEMHDNFKEEESEQFEQVKQELDVALKNCKILQIRLNKAERQYNQLEQVKIMLEKQLEDSVKSSDLTPAINTPSNFIQCGSDFVKLSTIEYDQLLRDLNDTIERDKDLQEQMKYSQEEAQLKGDRLQAVEAENELLLNKVNKLTNTNLKLRLTKNTQSIYETNASEQSTKSSDMIEQSEQLKLALELSQAECERLRTKLEESKNNLESKENTLKELESKRAKLEEELARMKLTRQPLSGGSGFKDADNRGSELVSKLELECRQLRARLVRAERECKQLKGQIELGEQPATTSRVVAADKVQLENDVRYKLELKQECENLQLQNKLLEKRIEELSANQNVGESGMEKDLLEKLKRQFEASENELVKTRSRLVELNLEYSQIQRKYKRLVESLENTTSIDSLPLARKTRLPPEPMRDPMSRQELRQAIRDLEEEIAEWLVVVKSKDCLLKEFRVISTENKEKKSSDVEKDVSIETNSLDDAKNPPGNPSNSNGEEQVKNLRKTLEKQYSFIDNLKIDISNLEKENIELQTNSRMLERKCLAMDEEVDKLRQVNGDLRLSIEEAKKNQRITNQRYKDLQMNFDKLRVELIAAQQVNVVNVEQQTMANTSKEESVVSTSGNSSPASSEVLLLSRDLSELKVKNGFLIRQLEMARQETQRQLDDLRLSQASQQRRAVEVAQLELKERHLAETQILRDQLNDLKQKLATSQRQLTRSEEEINGERDRLRSLERDWRRDNSQWTQKIEQLEAQMSIEKRSSEFKLKEAESQTRDKERELISLQDKYVQLERDFKRMQNKYNLLEENSESKQKQLIRELESKKRELSELISRSQSREDEYYDNCKRFNNEKATISEALESVKRSYDEKLLEIKSIRELLLLRQEQAFKERTSAQEKLDQLGGQLMKMSEYETQAKLSNHQLQVQEKQIESLKRELCQLKEDRTRLRTRIEEFERKCQLYEKQELINKTTSISPSTTTSSSFLKSARNPFNQFSSSSSGKHSSNSTKQTAIVRPINGENVASDSVETTKPEKNQYQMIEKLSSKINDQSHLINLLKQQHAEAQMELKQLKLLHSTERNKWQSRLTQITSRLNEAEEKLLFESSQLIGQEMFDSSKKKMEIKWSEERQTILNLLQQQQGQNEMLMRDLKKLSQTHDLLRLQSKQLESQNNRLSRKLIEYQQSVSVSKNNNLNDDKLNIQRDLDECMASRREIEQRLCQLEKLNKRLMKVMEEQARPLVEIVSKIITSMDGSSSSDTKRSSLESNNSNENPIENQPTKEGQSQVNSLQRPLLVTSPPTTSSSVSSEPIKTAEPAHQVNNQQRSRLSRFLTTGSVKTQSEATGNSSQPKPAKNVKKVRVKSASLGITPSEKKQLKKNLEELSGLFGELSRESKNLEKTNKTSFTKSNLSDSTRASSEIVDRSPPVLSNPSRTSRGVSYTPTRSISGNDSPRVVHWTDPLDQSDLDSEKSWSMSQLEQSPSVYKRFPQSTPSSYNHASLTDYDSETSLASECSTYSAGATLNNILGSKNKYSIAGAESDSCMATSGISSVSSSNGKTGAKKKRGLKMRLTSTLRNISRSISGLASDSEASYDNTGHGNVSTSNQEENKPTKTSLREIRV